MLVIVRSHHAYSGPLDFRLVRSFPFRFLFTALGTPTYAQSTEKRSPVPLRGVH